LDITQEFRYPLVAAFSSGKDEGEFELSEATSADKADKSSATHRKISEERRQEKKGVTKLPPLKVK
jgi:hypothetical protein